MHPPGVPLWMHPTASPTQMHPLEAPLWMHPQNAPWMLPPRCTPGCTGRTPLYAHPTGMDTYSLVQETCLLILVINGSHIFYK